jgi:hypothetical protein
MDRVNRPVGSLRYAELASPASFAESRKRSRGVKSIWGRFVSISGHAERATQLKPTPRHTHGAREIILRGSRKRTADGPCCIRSWYLSFDVVNPNQRIAEMHEYNAADRPAGAFRTPIREAAGTIWPRSARSIQRWRTRSNGCNGALHLPSPVGAAR